MEEVFEQGERSKLIARCRVSNILWNKNYSIPTELLVNDPRIKLLINNDEMFNGDKLIVNVMLTVYEMLESVKGGNKGLYISDVWEVINKLENKNFKSVSIEQSVVLASIHHIVEKVSEWFRKRFDAEDLAKNIYIYNGALIWIIGLFLRSMRDVQGEYVVLEGWYEEPVLCVKIIQGDACYYLHTFKERGEYRVRVTKDSVFLGNYPTHKEAKQTIKPISSVTYFYGGYGVYFKLIKLIVIEMGFRERRYKKVKKIEDLKTYVTSAGTYEDVEDAAYLLECIERETHNRGESFRKNSDDAFTDLETKGRILSLEKKLKQYLSSNSLFISEYGDGQFTDEDFEI